ncbi:MAG TPA: chorismate mutase [bacterium]|nr:chorismate mutase [bacterium]
MKDLSKIREEIDQIDGNLLTLLGKRMSLLPKVIEYKRSNQLSILDAEREQAIIDSRKSEAIKNGLSQNFVEELFQSILEESRRIQQEIIDEKS